MSDDALVRALADPATYPHAPAAVEHVQTHISHVFLAGPYVYKLKKPVVFPFLDFSTAERRLHFCREEVRLNARLSPDVYLGVVPLTRDAAGRVRLGGPGAPLDHVVWMRRLPADRLLPRLVARDAVTASMLDDLARHLAAFHARCDTGPAIAARADPGTLEAAWRENLDASARFVGTLLAREDHAILTDFGPAFVRRHDTLLRARQQAGRIRDGHGDLHAEHVCFTSAPVPAPDRPALPPGIHVFDCLEFSPDLRAGDVAAETAFLTMDLERLGRPDLARHLAASYAAATDDPDLHVLLPFYACARACVRGKVEGLQAIDAGRDRAARRAASARARRYFALALRLAWRAAGPALVLVAGPSGSGKTALAEAIAAATGFVHLSSDVLRKRGAGLPLREPGGPGLYTPAARAAVYAALAAAADDALAAGEGVIADATFLARSERARLAAVAGVRRVPWIVLRCDAPEAVVRTRLAARTQAPSVSDARWETYLAQRDAAEPLGDHEPHVAVDTGGTVAGARAEALRALWERAPRLRLGTGGWRG